MSDRYGLVKKYFSLIRSNKKAKKRMKQMECLFYSRNMYTRQEPKEDGLWVTTGFRQDKEVVLYTDGIAEVERRIEKNNKKMKYLKNYLNTLPESEKEYVYKRYVQREGVPVQEKIDNALLDEIQEIEEAINHMYGFEPEQKEFIPSEDIKQDFNNMLELLGVE